MLAAACIACNFCWISLQVIDECVVSAAQPDADRISHDIVGIQNCARKNRGRGIERLDADLSNECYAGSALADSRVVRDKCW